MGDFPSLVFFLGIVFVELNRFILYETFHVVWINGMRYGDFEVFGVKFKSNNRLQFPIINTPY